MYECLIKNARIIDGSGADSYTGTVAIDKDKIKIIPRGTPAEAKQEIDATGKVLCPGFIDAHTHGDMPLGQEFASFSKINQGITTQLGGMCGMSMAPVDPKYVEKVQASMGMLLGKFPDEMATFTTYGKYMDYAKKIAVPENTKFLVGHLTLRVAAMGYANREPTRAEMDNMKAMLEEALQAGAGGLSSGLVYVPSAYGKEDELAELCKVVAKHNGIYTTHMRNEGDQGVEAVQEALNTCRKSGVDLIISHHKFQGVKNWGKSRITLEMINRANEVEGLSVHCDQYPYTASQTQLSVCAPPEYYDNGMDGMVKYLKDPVMREKIRKDMNDPDHNYENYYLNSGGWKGVLISKSVNLPEIEGMTIQAYADKIGKDPFDVFCDVMIANDGVATAIYFTMCEEDLFRIIRNKYVMVGSDGILRAADDKPHPRALGTFPHAIRIFVKENRLLSLEEMIHKMTGMTAAVTKIPNKGLIKDGYDADLLIFDYDKLYDRADYKNPNLPCEGIEYVFVNGQLTYHDMKLTGAKAGRLVLMNQG